MDIFASNVFNDSVMRESLPKSVYKKLKKTIDEGLPLDPSIADVVANAMKDWAVEKGATHYTHWFQPMTGVTAEKHDSFISPTNDGKVLMEFSGKELIKGEPDASSFPNGGLRSTFEARGYTAWDCTSPAFLREDAGGVTLCIPTVFCSYTGEVLDKKTPLLRSMEAISKQAFRIVKLFGNTTATRVVTTVGAEQEYFLIDEKFYEKRIDLMFTGRTLFGAVPPKGQELEDHYFGAIKERVASFMKEVNTELWKLGVTAKTQHNEVSPAQFEMAPVFTTTNIASDHNQLVMDTLKKIAKRHGLVCLLHEKPFAGVNGSGKHNNWSMSTNDGYNLLEPGNTPHENAQFLTFLAAVIKAVDDYSELLRVSAATAGNDYRLGGNEAPPAIISIFLGEQLTDILEQMKNGGAKTSKQGEPLTVGVNTLPLLNKDATDRNRTSPFAFTGNKFEFRMVPSSVSIAGPNMVLNTIVAEVLCQFADILEKAEDFQKELRSLLKGIVQKHSRIIFNGNNYSKEWIIEAQKRGLPNITSTVEAMPHLISDKAVFVFTKHNVFTKEELHSRYEILFEIHNKQINIEASTMLDMAKRQILPAACKYAEQIARTVNEIKSALPDVDITSQEDLLKEVTLNIKAFREKYIKLEKVMQEAKKYEDVYKQGEYYRDVVLKTMNELRVISDELEKICDAEIWPLPTYTDMLFKI